MDKDDPVFLQISRVRDVRFQERIGGLMRRPRDMEGNGEGLRAELSQTYARTPTHTRAADRYSRVSRGGGCADSKMSVLSSCMHEC
jgi:hypothetical protein